MNDEKTISTKEAAAIFGVSEATFLRRVASGEVMPANKPNPRLRRQTFRFNRAYIESLLNTPPSE